MELFFTIPLPIEWYRTAYIYIVRLKEVDWRSCGVQVCVVRDSRSVSYYRDVNFVRILFFIILIVNMLLDVFQSIENVVDLSSNRKQRCVPSPACLL